MNSLKIITVKPRKLNETGFVGAVAGLISFLAGLLLAILAFRLVFRLLGANPGNGLVQWVYDTSAPFVAPFRGIFNGSVDLTTGRFEIETLVAIIVYGVIAALILSMFSWGRRRPTTTY